MEGTDDTVDDKDPGNGEVIGRLARSGAAEVDSAVQAALRAAPGWAGMAASAAPEFCVRPRTNSRPAPTSGAA